MQLNINLNTLFIMKRKCIFCGEELKPQGNGKWICPFCEQDYTQEDFDYQDHLRETC